MNRPCWHCPKWDWNDFPRPAVVRVGVAGWQNAECCVPCAHAFEAWLRRTRKWRWLTTTVTPPAAAVLPGGET